MTATGRSKTSLPPPDRAGILPPNARSPCRSSRIGRGFLFVLVSRFCFIILLHGQPVRHALYGVRISLAYFSGLRNTVVVYPCGNEKQCVTVFMRKVRVPLNVLLSSVFRQSAHDGDAISSPVLVFGVNRIHIAPVGFGLWPVACSQELPSLLASL